MSIAEHMQAELKKNAETNPQGQSGEQQQQQQQGNNQQEGGEQQQQAEQKPSLASILKERGIELGTDLSDDEIMQRVKGAPPVDSQRHQEPPPPNFDPTEDEVLTGLTAKGKNRDYYNRIQEQKKMADYDLVRLHWKEQLAEQHPDMTDEHLDAILKDKFSISDQEDEFTDAEKAIGAMNLLSEASRIRMTDGVDVEDVEYEITSEKRRKHNALAMEQKLSKEVDAFVPSMPKKLSFAIGKVGENDLGTMDIPVDPKTAEKVVAIMKNPALLSKEFTDPTTGNTDYAKLSSMLTRFFSTEEAIRATAIQYSSRANERHSARLNNEPDLNRIPGADGVTVKTDKELALEHNTKVAGQMLGGGVR